MRSVVYDRHGDPSDVLRLDTSGRPRSPEQGEVTVRVLKRPVHFGDLVQLKGQMNPDKPSTPGSPGVEGMGVVEAVGPRPPGVEPGTVEPGTRVAFFPVSGAWSEYVTIPAALVVPVPDHVSDATAALLLINPLTTLMLLRDVEDALRGDANGVVVQTAAGSSVGKLVTAAVVERGLRLVNLVRSASGAVSLGTRFAGVPTVSTSDDDWHEQVHAATGGKGARVVLDALGGSHTPRLAELLADGGTLVLYGGLNAGPQPTPLESLNLIGRELTIRGASITRWMTRAPAERAEDVAAAVELGVTAPELFEVAAEYDLADYAEAIRHLHRPGRTGAILLTSPAA
ncbi:alcohol dehydrogenase [Streptomyces sp. 150FB]|uniref:zinc-binding dehydrogenase n=1 Tax=Streptomyces sp. 150FB TaxID=1576605 RepID=UPI0005893B60|nr:zinc-binding dehydrogenase [Streptomyces sp. 150FB]KIF75534.1 alcohol dehydrogenase [Streptomyces sp. 150FB]